MNNYISKR